MIDRNLSQQNRSQSQSGSLTYLKREYVGVTDGTPFSDYRIRSKDKIVYSAKQRMKTIRQSLVNQDIYMPSLKRNHQGVFSSVNLEVNRPEIPNLLDLERVFKLKHNEASKRIIPLIRREKLAKNRKII